MTQYARPENDVLTGSWTTTPLYQKIDEVTPSDSDFISYENANTTCEVGLSDVTDPQDHTNHVIKIRARKAGNAGITVYLYEEGMQEICSWSPTLTTSFAEYSRTLSEFEASMISEYGALSIRIVGTFFIAGGCGVSWLEFSLPDASGGDVEVSPTAVSVIASRTNPTVVLGSITISPAARSAITTSVNPTIVAATTYTPNASSAVASRINPSVILSSIAITPSAGSTIASRDGPNVVLGSVLISPTASQAIATKTDPAIILSSISLTPNAATTICSSQDPDIVSDLVIAPTELYSIAQTENPSVINDVILAIQAIHAVTSGVAPETILGSITISPQASTVASATNPTVILGSITVTDTSSTVASSTNPTVALDDLVYSPAAAQTIASATQPAIILGSLSITPATTYAVSKSQTGNVVLVGYLKPSSDLSVGNWTNELDGTTNIYLSIDELPPGYNDEDYIQSEINPSSSPYTATLDPGTDPGVSYLHYIEYRYMNPGGTDLDLTVTLLEGAVTIAEWNHSHVPMSWTSATQVLTTEQVESISDYSNLRLKFTALTGAPE